MADTVETRNFNTTQHTINSLTAYRLGTDQDGTGIINAYIYDGSYTYNFNFDIIVRHSGGTEDVIGSGVAQTSRTANGSGNQNATWDCPSTSLESTDAIKVVSRVVRSSSATLTHITPQVSSWSGSDKARLVNATWTIYRYTVRGDDEGIYGQIFLVGHPSYGAYHSYISNFTYGAEAPTIKTVTDAGGGSDNLNRNKTLTISDTASGADYLSLPIPKSDTGVGVDSVEITVNTPLTEVCQVSEGVNIVSRVLTVTDSASISDNATNYTGDHHLAADTASGLDAVFVAVRLTIQDNGGGVDSLTLSGNLNTLLLAVFDFPAGQVVECQIADGDGNILRVYSADGVLEVSDGQGNSEYRLWFTKLTNGIVRWQIPSTTWKARELINIYSSLADGMEYTSVRASKLDNLNATVGSRLASADYTAPDNAGVAANGVAIDALPTLAEILAGGVATEATLSNMGSNIASTLSGVSDIQKWKTNKLTRLSTDGIVETWVLYDNDGVTPLSTWLYNTQTLTRSKAT